MNGPVITRRALAVFTVMAALMLIYLFVPQYLDRRTHVVFCNVGQGNAVYIRAGQTDILIDTGPKGGAVFSCLGAHMPFYDRTIEYLVISHPQSDHDGSALELMKRYTVRKIVMAASFRSDPRALQFLRAAPAARQVFVGGGLHEILGANTYLDFLSAETALQSAANDNDRSLIVSFTTIGRQYLFTGDISATILSSLTHTKIRNKLILLVPHHGSAYGLSDFFLKTARPAAAVISVGKNSYGHPAKKTLDLLLKNGVPYKRTDRAGDVEFTE